jgi:hypothetical protein
VYKAWSTMNEDFYFGNSCLSITETECLCCLQSQEKKEVSAVAIGHIDLTKGLTLCFSRVNLTGPFISPFLQRKQVCNR